MTEALLESADEDSEARTALWRAICLASEDIGNRFAVRSILGVGGATVAASSPLPGVATWQLVEALSLLGVVLRSDTAVADEVSIFGKTGPIEIREDGSLRWLWAQQTLRGDRSSLAGRPDLIVTTSRELPHPGNAARIIEAKCVKDLGTQTVRSEFGKAHDLRVASYLIWSFFSPRPKVVAGARGLGIDLEALGFDTERRADLIRDPEALIARVVYSQEQARRTQRFAGALEEAGQQARRKLLDS
jgi:hypothetical protein